MIVTLLIQIVTLACLQDHPNMDQRICKTALLDHIHSEVLVAKRRVNAKDN